jgi:hypothetical protein
LLGWEKTAFSTLEQLNFCLIFKMTKHAADNRLGDVQDLGRADNRPRFHDGVEDFDLPQREHQRCFCLALKA